ncbi:hypothetical protein ACJMK2_032625 [Sinanodonta woodiana]|uniref:G-protein coupled receptors family 1 profile domain-containing protein n=1 Tax=Sinanodonta woodiana TaxID=1069815 RepID=A0ABD3X3U0_SINWO
MNSSQNYQQDGINWTLEEENDEHFKVLIPAVVLSVIAMIIGIFGNSLVLYIFKYRYKPSSHRCFILCLATFDIMFDVIGIPFMIVEMRLQYIFTDVVACKIHRIINYSYGSCSALTVMVIAIDRYLKVCKSNGKQITHKMAKGMCFIITFLGIIGSLPSLELYGHRDVPTTIPNVNTTQCQPKNKYKEDVLFPTLFNCFLALCFMATMVTVCICYTMIVRKVKTQKAKWKTTLLPDNSTCTRSLNSSEDPSTTSNQAIIIHQDVCNRIHVKSTSTVKTHRVAKMLFVVTAVFFCSYIPYFCLIITVYANNNLKDDWSKMGEAFFELFWRSFLINSFANPIIYGFMDKKFRDECNTLLNKFINRRLRRIINLTFQQTMVGKNLNT